MIFSSFGISILIIMLPSSYHAKREIEKRVNYYLSIFKFLRQIYFSLKDYSLLDFEQNMIGGVFSILNKILKNIKFREIISCRPSKILLSLREERYI